MPECGSQVYLCNLPIRFDTYKGCSHGCKYCFVYRKYNIEKIKPYEGIKALQKFIDGKRTLETNWCDWNIPLHWGGVSDPFQPAELRHKYSLEALKLFAKSKYPFVVSTKSILPAEEPYYSLLKECNFVFQLSMLAPEYDKIEPHAPTFQERLNILPKMAKIARRVIVRNQPYIIDYHTSIISQYSKYADAGVYGVTVESIKMNKKLPGLIKMAGDFVYPREILLPKFKELKRKAHKLGLVFLSGENRFRKEGDSLNCCGVGDLEGFKDNSANLNSYIYDRDKFKFSKQMNKVGTAECFGAMMQTTNKKSAFDKMSFAECMTICTKDKVKVSSLI